MYTYRYRPSRRRYRYARRYPLPAWQKGAFVLAAAAVLGGTGAAHAVTKALGHGHASPAAPTGHAAAAIAFARQQIGCPYVYGGTGPCGAGFDCSGLIMEAYRAAGVDIPRTSEEQWAGLRHIPAGQQRPGDLVFFVGSPIDPPPGHVGLVLTRHLMIEAYSTGYPVRISPYGVPSAAEGDTNPVGFARP